MAKFIPVNKQQIQPMQPVKQQVVSQPQQEQGRFGKAIVDFATEAVSPWVGTAYDLRNAKQYLEKKGFLGKAIANASYVVAPQLFMAEKALQSIENLPSEQVPNFIKIRQSQTSPTAMQLVGDLGGVALDIFSGGLASSLKVGKPILKRAITSGAVGASSMLASSLSAGKDVKQVVKDIPLGIGASVVGGELLHQGVTKGMPWLVDTFDKTAMPFMSNLYKVASEKAENSKWFSTVSKSAKNWFTNDADRIDIIETKYGLPSTEKIIKKTLGAIKAQVAYIRNIIENAEKKDGLNFNKVKELVIPDNVPIIGGKKYTGEDARNMAEILHYGHGLRPDFTPVKMVTNAENIGKVLKRIDPADVSKLSTFVKNNFTAIDGDLNEFSNLRKIPEALRNTKFFKDIKTDLTDKVYLKSLYEDLTQNIKSEVKLPTKGTINSVIKHIENRTIPTSKEGIKLYDKINNQLRRDRGLEQIDFENIINDLITNYGAKKQQLNELDFIDKMNSREIIDQGLREFKLESIARNIMVDRQGKKVPFGLIAEENYKPHDVFTNKNIDLLKKESVRDGVKMNIMLQNKYYNQHPELIEDHIKGFEDLISGNYNKDKLADNEFIKWLIRDKGMTLEQATETFESKVLTKYGKVTDKTNMLDEANDLGILIYNPNSKEAFYNYHDSYITKYDKIDAFGGVGDSDNPKVKSLYKHFENIKEAILGDKELKTNKQTELIEEVNGLVDNMLDRITDKDDSFKWIDIFALPTALKLGTTQILQAAQAINNSALTTDLYSTTKAILNMYNEKEYQDFVISGAGGSELVKSAISGGDNLANKLSGKFLDTTGMTKADIMARNINALAGKYYAEKMFKGLQSNKNNDFYIRELKKMNLNPDELLAKGKLEYNDILDAMFAKSAEGQFLSLSSDLPRYMRSSQVGRAIAKFRPFGFQQTNLFNKTIKEMFQDWDRGKEGKQKVLKNLFVLGLLSPVVGGTATMVKKAFTGASEPKDVIEWYTEQMLDTVGYPSEIYNAIKYNENPIDKLTGIVGIQPGEAINIISADNKYQATVDFAGKTLGFSPKRSRQFANYIFGTDLKVPKYKKNELNIVNEVNKALQK